MRATAALEIDPALTYFRARHYHRPWLLDCRVRKGNGYFQPGMGTGRRLVCRGGEAEADEIGLVERVVEGSSEDEIKPIDWLVPVS